MHSRGWLEERTSSAATGRNFKAAIEAGPVPALIAECKQRSPSGGELVPDYDVGRIVAAFEHAGASAISVLTNEDDFGGQVEDLLLARRACSLPLLRKDFLLDEEEMAESRAGGADCVLLIARIHGESRLKEMCAAAHEQGLQVLLELYSDSELEGALRAQPDLLGINQRNLDTLEIDDAIFQRVAPLVPEGLPLVAESGVGTRGQMLAAARAGARAVLAGESLLRAPDLEVKVRELLGR